MSISAGCNVIHPVCSHHYLLSTKVQEAGYAWLLGVSDFVSILFSVIVSFAPLHGLLFFVLFIEVYSIFMGVTQLARAWDLRSALTRGVQGT